MPKGTYVVTLKRRANDGSLERLEAGRFTVEGLSYESLDDTYGLLHLRANRQQYGYEVNQDEQMVYFGPHAVRLEQFEGLEVSLVSKSVD